MIPAAVVLVIVFLGVIASARAEGAAFTAKGSNLHLNTPGGMGSFIIDETVDVKKMKEMFETFVAFASAQFTEISSTIQSLQVCFIIY